MRLVNYLAYRDHEKQRVKTNDTMMGLLAGSRLASQTLLLTSGSKVLLSEIFPAVDHVHRFNLTADRARAILNEAEELLGILAVPQVIALHEDLLVGMLKLLEDYIPEVTNISKGAKSANIHSRFEGATGICFNPLSLELFHLIRIARNTHIHNGGKAGASLVNKIGETSTQAFTLWKSITKSEFCHYKLGDPVGIGLPELIGSLAVTKRLAEEGNTILQRKLPTSAWADIAVADWLTTRRSGNPDQLNRQLLGQVRQHYGPVGLEIEDLDAARVRAGVA